MGADPARDKSGIGANHLMNRLFLPVRALVSHGWWLVVWHVIRDRGDGSKIGKDRF